MTEQQDAHVWTWRWHVIQDRWDRAEKARIAILWERHGEDICRTCNGEGYVGPEQCWKCLGSGGR